MNSAIKPFKIAIPQADLDDLQQRLERTRFPDRELVEDGTQGAPLDQVQKLVEYWRTHYDWRRCEAFLNSMDQFTTCIDGVDIWFLHVRSPNPDAIPLLLTHGWPGSVTEFFKVIGPLSDPAAQGGNPADAFHLVIPALPGFGFSGKPQETGWTAHRIAAAWPELMQRLGYQDYVAQGGDWGGIITTYMGHNAPAGLKAIHLNLGMVVPPPPYDNPNPAELAMLQALDHFAAWESGYAAIQSTRPQTLGYALADSPVGQAAWIYEKFQRFTDSDLEPLNVLTYDELLDNITLYWLTNSGTSAGRIYWETDLNGFRAVNIDIPVGYTVFPKEAFRIPRSWADRCMSNIIYWNEVDKGGHFAAVEQPEIFVDEVRACFRQLRGSWPN